VPPSIIDARTSADIVVKEGSPVNLSCDARGSPRPKIMWKREDGDLIRYNGGIHIHKRDTYIIEPNINNIPDNKIVNYKMELSCLHL